eukprot:1443618-Amphidinium_carterae.1
MCGNPNATYDNIINLCSCEKFYERYSDNLGFQLYVGMRWDRLDIEMKRHLAVHGRTGAVLGVLRSAISSYAGLIASVGILSEAARTWADRLNACDMVNGTVPGKHFCPSESCQVDS